MALARIYHPTSPPRRIHSPLCSFTGRGLFVLCMLASLISLAAAQDNIFIQSDDECYRLLKLADTKFPHDVLNEEEYRLLVNEYLRELYPGTKPFAKLPDALDGLFMSSFGRGGEIKIHGVRNGENMTPDEETFLKGVCSTTVSTLTRIMAPAVDDSSAFTPVAVMEEEERQDGPDDSSGLSETEDDEENSEGAQNSTSLPGGGLSEAGSSEGQEQGGAGGDDGNSNIDNPGTMGNMTQNASGDPSDIDLDLDSEEYPATNNLTQGDGPIGGPQIGTDGSGNSTGGLGGPNGSGLGGSSNTTAGPEAANTLVQDDDTGGGPGGNGTGGMAGTSNTAGGPGIHGNMTQVDGPGLGGPGVNGNSTGGLEGSSGSGLGENSSSIGDPGANASMTQGDGPIAGPQEPGQTENSTGGPDDPNGNGSGVSSNPTGGQGTLSNMTQGDGPASGSQGPGGNGNSTVGPGAPVCVCPGDDNGIGPGRSSNITGGPSVANMTQGDVPVGSPEGPVSDISVGPGGNSSNTDGPNANTNMTQDEVPPGGLQGPAKDGPSGRGNSTGSTGALSCICPVGGNDTSNGAVSTGSNGNLTQYGEASDLDLDVDDGNSTGSLNLSQSNSSGPGYHDSASVNLTGTPESSNGTGAGENANVTVGPGEGNLTQGSGLPNGGAQGQGGNETVTVTSGFIIKSSQPISDNLSDPSVVTLTKAYLNLVTDVAADLRNTRRQLRGKRRLANIDNDSVEIYDVKDTECPERPIQRLLQLIDPPGTIPGGGVNADPPSQNNTNPLPNSSNSSSGNNDMNPLHNSSSNSSGGGSSSKNDTSPLPNSSNSSSSSNNYTSPLPSSSSNSSSNNDTSPLPNSSSGNNNNNDDADDDDSNSNQTSLSTNTSGLNPPALTTGASNTTSSDVVESNPVTSGTSGNGTCQMLLAKFDVKLAPGEDPATVKEKFSAATRQAIDAGELQKSIKEVDPESDITVEATTEPPLAPNQPPQSNQTQEPSSNVNRTEAPRDLDLTSSPTNAATTEASENDGGGVGVVMIVGIVVGGVLALCLCGAAAFMYSQKNKVVSDENDGEKTFEENPDPEQAPNDGDGADEKKSDNDMADIEGGSASQNANTNEPAFDEKSAVFDEADKAQETPTLQPVNENDDDGGESFEDDDEEKFAGVEEEAVGDSADRDNSERKDDEDVEDEEELRVEEDAENELMSGHAGNSDVAGRDFDAGDNPAEQNSGGEEDGDWDGEEGSGAGDGRRAEEENEIDWKDNGDAQNSEGDKWTEQDGGGGEDEDWDDEDGNDVDALPGGEEGNEGDWKDAGDAQITQGVDSQIASEAKAADSGDEDWNDSGDSADWKDEEGAEKEKTPH